ncbi:MAG: S1 RNA-binding domain-containing protein, partial [Deltaproteobacteria bacterium]|nr:S1 RNA-binding domain-containing protein [Deltaproteobacteria bacterium]
ELKDLKEGMWCPGIVTNVTNFGAFVDIGVHQDGLVHISQLSDRYVKDAAEVVSPGDRVTVRVLEVIREKNQIALTMKSPEGKRAPRPERPQHDGERPRGDRGQGRGGGGGGRPRPNGGGDRAPRVHEVAAKPQQLPSPQRQSAPQRPKGPPPARPKEAFNNPFAGLKDILKKPSSRD